MRKERERQNSRLQNLVLTTRRVSRVGRKAAPFIIGVAVGIGVSNAIPKHEASVVDCSEGRGGTLVLNPELYKEYPLEPAIGESDIIKAVGKGDVVVYTDAKKANPISLTSSPLFVETNYGVYKISNKPSGDNAIVVIDANCKSAK